MKNLFKPYLRSPAMTAPPVAEAPQSRMPRSRPLRVWAAYIAFFTTVFASMAAAASVATRDFSLLIGGL